MRPLPCQARAFSRSTYPTTCARTRGRFGDALLPFAVTKDTIVASPLYSYRASSRLIFFGSFSRVSQCFSASVTTCFPFRDMELRESWTTENSLHKPRGFTYFPPCHESKNDPHSLSILRATPDPLEPDSHNPSEKYALPELSGTPHQFGIPLCVP